MSDAYQFLVAVFTRLEDLQRQVSELAAQLDKHRVEYLTDDLVLDVDDTPPVPAVNGSIDMNRPLTSAPTTLLECTDRAQMHWDELGA